MIFGKRKAGMPLFLCILCVFLFSLPSCANADEAPPVFEEELEIRIPGVQEPVTLLWLSDLHMVMPGGEADPAFSDELALRVQYSSYEGQSAEKQWSGWVDILNRTEADAVIFGGDMLDLCSEDGVDALRRGMDKLNKPYLYARADHDLLPTYLKDTDAQKAKAMQDGLCKNEDVMSMAFDGFTLLVWNNSTSDLSDEGLARIRELAAEGKPLVLVTHVPIEPKEDESLAAASGEAFGGRSLIWGYRNAEYWPEENTRKLLDLLYAEDSPFAAVLCGHLHLSWDGPLSDSVKEHVFSAAFERHMGVIRISGTGQQRLFP